MPSIDQAFPSRYLKAGDVADTTPVVTITDTEMIEMGQGVRKEIKLLVKFKELAKGLVCNKTNANMIAKIAKSRNTDDWVGTKIRLVVNDVEFQGQIVEAIRVRQATGAKPMTKPAPVEREPGDEDITPDDSDIGF